MTLPTFLSPLYLAGILAALVPLVLHLSRSRRTKKMRFSTTRFFTDQFLRSQRMSRLKELLLLACRMALFAFLAISLARPFLSPSGGDAALAAGDGPRAVVIVLDDSASMSIAEDGKTLFRKAQDAARTVLANLSPSDTASVVLAGRRDEGPLALFLEPTDDLDEVRAAIDRLTPSALGTDLSGAIRRAEEVATGSRAAGRGVTIFVLSDLQESGFDAPPRDTTRADLTDTAFVFVSLRPKVAPANRGVTAVRYAATRPRVGIPFAIRPLLALGRDDGKDAAVRLVIDGAKVGEQKVERLPGGKWASPRFYHTFSEDGWHGGAVETDDEAMAADNKRYFAVEIPKTTQTVPLLAVNGAPSSVPALDELFFLRFALTAAPDGTKPPFDLRSVAPAELAGTDLSTYPLVILANVEKLSEAAVEKLEQYADAGGNVLAFLGDKVDPAFYGRYLSAANRLHGGLLPAAVKGLKLEDAGHVGEVQYEHRALGSFQEPKLGTLLGPSVTFKALRLDAPADAVLMKSSLGFPLLCEKPFGKGRVMLFASTADRDGGDFPIKPGYFLWTRFLAEYLTQSPLGRQAQYLTGETVRLTPPADEKGVLHVRKPDGKKVAAARASDGSGDFTFADTLDPGVYAVLGADQETRLSLFAVNLDTYESDLTYLDDGPADESPADRKNAVVADLKSRLGSPPLLSYVADPATLADSLGTSRGGVKLWNVLLALVLLIGLFEPWLANRISSGLFGKAAPIVVTQPGGPPR